MKPVREPDAGKLHVRFDEEGRETRGVMVHSANGHRTRKGGNGGAPPDLYMTALALHSTERMLCVAGSPSPCPLPLDGGEGSKMTPSPS